MDLPRPTPVPLLASSRPTRRALLRAAGLGGLAATAVPLAGPAYARPMAHRATRPAARHIAYAQWSGAAAWRRGERAGVHVRGAALTLGTPSGHRHYAGRRYDEGTWTSPWSEPGFALTELVASWSAETPGDSWIEVAVRGRTGAGRVGSWDVLGRWAAGDHFLKRRTVSGQSDDLGAVSVDTWKAGSDVTAWQLRVSLLRVHGAGDLTPVLHSVGAMCSALPDALPATSSPGPARGVTLDVPRYSQMVHDGDYPQWNGGGDAWCSPTSTSMVLGYYDALPAPATYAWVRRDHPHHPQPWVDEAARQTYDYAYEGTGNWPFNTAYAGPLAGHAFVTRLRSLREAEAFVAAGIPLVASIAFAAGGLEGAPISSTNGHLIVIAGFTRAGDVVVNDPAASTADGVRRTYDRAQLERAWLGGSGGTVYVIRDDAHPLPAGSPGNW